MQVELVKLYNGINNDYSIQRYTLGWSNVIDSIEKRARKPIKTTNDVFTNKLVLNALKVSTGRIERELKAFAKELQINIETLHLKK